MRWFIRIVRFVLTVLLIVVIWHTIVRIIRHFYKFPIPAFLTDLIDNPLRRRLQPPDATAVRHEAEPGMCALDVGPGNGAYTLALARRVGPEGHVIALDIEPKVIRRVQARIAEAGVANLSAEVGDVYDLDYEDGFFDLATMMTVLGEIPQPGRALAELRRVLKPGGKLAISELLVDPDYPLASGVITKAEAAGFRLLRRKGNFFYYTLIFEA